MMIVKKTKKSSSSGWPRIFLAASLSVFLSSLPLEPAEAICSCGANSCYSTSANNLATTDSNETVNTINEFGTALPIVVNPPGNTITAGTGQLGRHEEWLYNVLFIQNILPPFLLMTESLTTVIMAHTFAIGGFFDAKNQMTVQDLFSWKRAEAYKDYHPSPGMCVFGTSVRSLAASERRSQVTRSILSQRLLDRQLQNANSSGTEGSPLDDRNRVRYFRTRVCDSYDNNRKISTPATGFSQICGAGPRAAGTVNKDLDFTRMVMYPRTINADFINTPAGFPNPDEEYLLSLASNLYANHLFPLTVKDALAAKKNDSVYMDYRSAVARHSVAQSSFDALVGLKVRGTPNTGGGGSPTGSADTLTYMTLLLEELGLTAAEARDLMGENPSYYAQMEVLAKRIYQRGGFYVDLYDKPANVKRKSVAMQAIALMLDREIFESYVRSEAILSQILEIRVAKKQKLVEDSLAKLRK